METSGNVTYAVITDDICDRTWTQIEWENKLVIGMPIWKKEFHLRPWDAPLHSFSSSGFLTSGLLSSSAKGKHITNVMQLLGDKALYEFYMLY